MKIGILGAGRLGQTGGPQRPDNSSVTMGACVYVGTFHVGSTHRRVFHGVWSSCAWSIGLIDIVRVVDGRVTEHWNVVDTLGLLQQLGVLPARGQATGKP